MNDWIRWAVGIITVALISCFGWVAAVSSQWGAVKVKVDKNEEEIDGLQASCVQCREDIRDDLADVKADVGIIKHDLRRLLKENGVSDTQDAGG
jgi:hypothetical protein